MTQDSIYSKRSLLVHDYFVVLRVFETLFPQLMKETQTPLTKIEIRKRIAEIKKLLDTLSSKLEN